MENLEEDLKKSGSSAMEVRGEGSEVGLGFPVWIACRRRLKPDDPFFAAGNMERELLAKQVALDLTEEERYQLQKMEIASDNIFCPVAGCGAHLESLDMFEEHYNTRHTASCSVCSRVYPTNRLLSIHISETHDSFFQAKVSRGFPMYECLVEGCDAKFKTYKSRQRHLVDKHQFPASFEFCKRARLSKHQREKYHKKAYRAEATKDPDKDGMEIDAIVLGVSKLSTVDSNSPKNVSFGHRNSRAFAFVPRSIRNQNQNLKKETS